MLAGAVPGECVQGRHQHAALSQPNRLGLTAAERHLQQATGEAGGGAQVGRFDKVVWHTEHEVSNGMCGVMRVACSLMPQCAIRHIVCGFTELCCDS
jgi:hypothetical protein